MIAAALTGSEHGDVEATRAAHEIIKASPDDRDRHMFGIVDWPEAGGWFGTCRVCASSVLVFYPEPAEVAA